jgi:hypothetical protein
MNGMNWLATSMFLAALCVADELAAAPPELRWVYLQQNLQVKENLPKIEAILRRAKAAGYNGVVLADYKLNILDRVPEHYFANAAEFKRICAVLELEIIPTVCGFGYSSGILAHDPNLAEGLPVRDQPVVVRAGRAEVDKRVNLVPGDFEQRKEDLFGGWGFQDEPGKGTFADTAVKHVGAASLRIENPKGTRGNRRVSKPLRVRPWTQFHASAWIKTEGFETAGEARMFAIGAEGRVLSHSNLGVKRDQDWTQHHAVFNSLESSEIRFYVGAWDCGSGKLWLDDVEVFEEPFVNLVRRPGCPLKVTDESGKVAYEEGRDFSELRDPRLGMTPWQGEFDIYHQPPALTVLPGGRIKQGQKLLVSYYHAVTIYDGQVPCSLTEPKVFEIVEDQVRRVNELFQPKTYFLSHDEIRVAGWSEPETASGKSSGELLAENVRRCVSIIKKQSPDAKLCIWSDMFDPHHNAKDQFYLVRGDLAGSWEGLPKDVLIINWNSGQAATSLPFFAQRGHGQILAGYYDAPPDRIKTWLAAGDTKSSASIRGVMYTTWQSNFSDLEKFAAAAWQK